MKVSLESLIEKYPIPDVLGSAHDYWAGHGGNILNFAAVNSEVEGLLRHLVDLAVTNGRWTRWQEPGLSKREVGMLLDATNGDLTVIDAYCAATPQESRLSKSVYVGLVNSLKKRFITFEAEGNEVFISPREGLAEYLKHRAPEYVNAQTEEYLSANERPATYSGLRDSVVSKRIDVTLPKKQK